MLPVASGAVLLTSPMLGYSARLAHPQPAVSHSRRVVEHMAALDVWLLCCWGLVNGLQQQACWRCALWPPAAEFQLTHTT